MSTIAELMVQVGVDMNGFAQGMNTMQAQLNTFGDSATKAGQMLTLGVTLPLVAFGAKAIQLASDLAEVQNVVDVTFGDSANVINDWSKTTMEGFGLTELQSKKMASTMGAMTKSMGLSDEQMRNMAMSLTELTGDMSSFHNLPHEVMWEKIRAGITGETEPLKELGINMSAAALETFALEQGITKTYESMTEAEKVTLRYNFLMKATADAQGDYNRTSEGFANKLRELQGTLSEVAATIGLILLPYALELVKWASDMLKKFQELTPEAQKNAVAFAGIATAIGPLLVGIGFISKAIAPVLGLVSKLALFFAPATVAIAETGAAATAAGPGFAFLSSIMTALGTAAAAIGVTVGVLVAIVVAVIAVIVAWGVALKQLWDDNEDFRAKIKIGWEDISRSIMDLIGPTIEFLKKAWADIKAAYDKFDADFGAAWKALWGGFKEGVAAATNIIVQTIALFLNVLTGDWSGAWSNIKNIFSSTWDAIKGITSGVWNALKAIFGNAIKNVVADIKNFVSNLGESWGKMKSDAIEKVTSIWTAFKGMVVNWLQAGKDLAKAIIDGIINGVSDGITRVVNKVKEMAGSAVTAAKHALSIKSPSRVFHEIGGYVTQGLANGIEDGSTTVKTAVSRMATAVITEANGMKTNMQSIALQMAAMSWTIAAPNTSNMTNAVATAVNGMKATLQSAAAWMASMSWAIPAPSVPNIPIATPITPSIPNTLQIIQSIPNTLQIIQGIPNTLQTPVKPPSNLSIGSGGPNNNRSINIENMTVRNDSDIESIAKRLYQLQSINSRVRGFA